MKNNLQFDILVDKENNTITIIREFMKGRQMVRDCHTKGLPPKKSIALNYSPIVATFFLFNSFLHIHELKSTLS